MDKKSTALEALSTRNQLIEAAVQLFYENGAHWVSFAQIAKKVGISQPAVYKHFADKDDLMKACILNAAESGRALIDAHIGRTGRAKKKLFLYLEANLAWMQNRPSEGAVLLAMYYFAMNSPPIKETALLINNQSVDRLASLLLAGIKEKAWSIQDPQLAARAIHDLLLGEMIKALHNPEEFQLAKRTRFLSNNVEKFIMAS